MQSALRSKKKKTKKKGSWRTGGEPRGGLFVQGADTISIVAEERTVRAGTRRSERRKKCGRQT